MNSPTILSVGYEHQLLRMRSLLLRECLGIEVLEAFNLASALQMARRKEQLSAILLCHAVPLAHQCMIIEAARERHHDIPALSIFPGVCAPDTAGTPVSNDPEQLLAAISNALEIQIQTPADTEQRC